MTDHDLSTDSVEIAENTYWVGKRPADGIFFANPYLRVFRGSNGSSDKTVNLIIDPGASSDFSVVQAKCAKHIGKIGRINAVFINHQDPDVGSIVGPLLARFNPKARVFCSEDTWRLVKFFNVDKSRYINTDPFIDNGMLFPTGHRVVPVPSPYCHFVGATMLYDPETRVLFTGDLFGGLTEKTAKGIWADETDWPGMRAFHQLYMPANAALKHAVERIRKLDPAPLVLAPQHGRIIRGEWIPYFLERIEELPVGVDLLDDHQADEATLNAWASVLSRVVETARGYLGSTAESRLIDDRELSDVLDVEDERWQVRRLGKWAVERAVHLLTEGEVFDVSNTIRYEAIFAASELDLPSPNIDLAEEGEGQMGVTPASQPMASADDPFDIAPA